VSYPGYELIISRSGHHRFILKDIPELIFDHVNEEVRPDLRDSHFIRLPVDTIPDKRVFIFRYLKEDLLSLVRKQIPMPITRRILKDSLSGLNEMHSQDIIHLGNGALFRMTMPKANEC
jgi:hypothetical protein